MKNKKNAVEEPDLEVPVDLDDIDNNFLFDEDETYDTESDDLNFIPDMTEHDIVRFIMHGNER